jgi:sulfur carrier protein ThiS adenylyltransferase
MEKERYLSELYLRNPPGSLGRLDDRVVGIAGAGGLGSNIAISLLRSGGQHFIIADQDRVELSNLNRQHYFFDQVGMEKTTALQQNMLRINPHLDATLHCTRITETNLTSLFARAEILIEALDEPDQKAMIARSWMRCFPERFLIMGSGLSGYGRNNTLTTTVHGRLVICGDQSTEYNTINGLTASRLGLVAQMQANATLEILLDGRIQ